MYILATWLILTQQTFANSWCQNNYMFSLQLLTVKLHVLNLKFHQIKILQMQKFANPPNLSVPAIWYE